MKSCSKALLARGREANLWTEEKEPLEGKRLMSPEGLDTGKKQVLEEKRNNNGNSLENVRVSDGEKGEVRDSSWTQALI